jgi:hypothetical protein
MTKKLQELFDLPMDDLDQIDVDMDEPIVEDTSTDIARTEAITTLEKINDALPRIRGLEAGDKEMDDLAALATDKFKDLMDLGMNVEARFSSVIFSAAGTLLGHAITAKNAKLNRKIKMLELQLKQAKQESDLNPDAADGVSTGHMMDRNELLAEILQQNKDADKKA